MLSHDTVSEAVRKAEYAVRGELVIKSLDYKRKLAQPNHGLPFDEVCKSSFAIELAATPCAPRRCKAQFHV